MKLEKTQRIHMVGVGGIGMSALARLFVHEGKTVSGSDRAASKITAELEMLGVTFSDEQIAQNITEDIELVVYTEAMQPDHPELVAAKTNGIPTMTYFEALGCIANQYYLIAVAGTHGKTTTTAMLTDVLEEAGLDPTAVVGSLRSKTGSNFRPGKSKYAVVEACEYRRNFLSLTPDVLIITNIETEHIDYFKTIEETEAAFAELVGQVRAGGAIICNSADESVVRATKMASVEVIDYTKYIDPRLRLKNPGAHNFQNAAAALAAADVLEIKQDGAQRALEHFAGTWRRFEYKGEMATGAPVYDDYAHHPTEISATRNAVRELYPDKRCIAVFQPHLYSRTAELEAEFVEALSGFDAVIITEVYDARVVKADGIDGATLARSLGGVHQHTCFMANFDQIAAKLRAETTSDDVVLLMGAGDIVGLTPMLFTATIDLLS